MIEPVVKQMSLNHKRLKLYSYGYGKGCDVDFVCPDSRSVFEENMLPSNVLSARGAGLSLTPSSMISNGTSVSMSQFNRVLSFDEEKGEIEIECGITLGRLAACVLPKGWFLPVQPGHPQITIGGCIASNAHGKHQYQDGTFIDVLKSITIFHPDRGLTTVRSGDELFELTCGGYGLTGLMVSAKIQLKRCSSTRFEIKNLPCYDLSELANEMSSVASGVDLLYSWHDFMESHADQRNAFIRTGRFVQEDMPDLRWDSYDFRMKKKAHHPLLKRMPCAYTRRTTSWLNRYFYKLESRSASQVQSIDRVLFPVKDRMVYYHLFGKAGVIEMQWLFPLDQWCSASIAIQTLVKDHVCPITLASGKLFRGTQKGLRFSGEGLCFSLNVPHHEKGLDFAHQMDQLGIAFKAKPNIIKDSRLPAEVLRSCYPDCDSTIKGFRKYDSQQRFQTELSKRLEL